MKKLLIDTRRGQMPSRIQENTQDVITAKEYTCSHLDQLLSISDIASHLNMSCSKFSHTFKSICGETYFAYTNRIRMEKAAQLLCETDLPIRTIAAMIGYAHTVPHFNKKFKTAYGMAPNEYRKNCKK